MSESSIDLQPPASFPPLAEPAVFSNGTTEVETLQREVTGRWLDEVHPHLGTRPGGFDRFHQMVQNGRATHRKGNLTFLHHKEHQQVENCMAPLARDGKTVDMIAVCSV